MDRLMTQKEAAGFLGVSERSIYNYIKAGKLRQTKVGCLVRIHPDDLRAFIDAGRVVAEEGGVYGR